MLKDFFRRDPPLRDTVYRSIRKLQAQHSRLDLAAAKLDQRKTVLFNKCTLAMKNGQKDRATIYANEIIEIKKMICRVSDHQINIERVILRLETIMDLGDIIKDLSPVFNIVQELAKQLATTMPKAKTKLNELKSTIADTLETTTLSNVKPLITPTEVQLEGTKEILQEAASCAEKTLKKKLPEPPTPVIQNIPIPAAHAEVRQLVSLTTSSSGAMEKMQPSTKSYLSYTDVKSRHVSLVLQRTPIARSQTIQGAEKTGGKGFGPLKIYQKNEKPKEKELVKAAQ
jgi:division protein CdvB (Snf7/Vps24/ESCRT-III family)